MGGVGTHQRAKRGTITGWSRHTAARHSTWLGGVDSLELTGSGYAVTLTLRECPASAEIFHRYRRAWLMRVQRMGAVRVHWVVEWTKRGVPHLHAAVYFAEPLAVEGVLAVHWLQAVDDSELARLVGQDVKPISGALGWLKYLAKHSGRGAAHYQRLGHPESWDRSGRMWGHTGAWPEVPPVELTGISNADFWRFRRCVRAWSIADARKAGDWSRVRALRRIHSRPGEKESRYQGVGEWIPETVSLRLLEYLSSDVPS